MTNEYTRPDEKLNDQNPPAGDRLVQNPPLTLKQTEALKAARQLLAAGEPLSHEYRKIIWTIPPPEETRPR